VIEEMSHQRVRYPHKGLILVLLLNGLFAAYLLVKPGTPQAVTFVDNLIQGLLEGAGLLLVLPLFLAFVGRKGSPQTDAIAKSSVQRWVPLLLSLAILSYIIGQGIWTYNENIAHLPVLFPSWADAGFLGSYPFLLLAILLLPVRPLTLQARMRIFLDGLIIMLAVVTFSWYFVLGPTILSSGGTAQGRIIGLTYPLMALLLIFCLLLLTVRSRDRVLQPAALLLSCALITIVVTDSIYEYLELHNMYTTGGLLDVGWPLGFMLVGLSARALQQQLKFGSHSSSPLPAPVPPPEQKRGIEQSSLLPQALIPLFFASAVVLLLIWTEFADHNTALGKGVSLGVVILLGLMVVRQVSVIWEEIGQNHLLQRIQRDLSERNEALQRANLQLEAQAHLEGAYEQQRHLNEMKDQFVLNVSHELRTPLTQVYGYLELLELYHNTLSSEQQMEFIHKATQGCVTLLPLINTILDATETGTYSTTLQTRELPLSQLVQSVLEEFGPLQQCEHPVQLEIAEGLAALGDHQYFCQTLRNLLSNAFKYTPPHTPVSVIATCCDPITHTQASNPQVCICVRDSGPGIPAEDIPLLFEKFVRLKRDLAGPIRGTGLGLYISKQLVEAMGGSIWVERSGDARQGSSFCFTLPAPAIDPAKPGLR
jgi:signal transduction histidine kinase